MKIGLTANQGPYVINYYQYTGTNLWSDCLTKKYM